MFIPAAPLVVNDDQKRDMEALLRNGNSSQRVVLRSRVVLLANQGLANHAIAQQLNVSRPTILALRAAFARQGMAAVTGIHRRKRKAKVLTPELEHKILTTTLKTRPGDGSTHWSTRKLAKMLGIHHNHVQTTWRRAGLKPHRFERYMLSDDPDFETKAADIIGLYVNPPQHAAVFCVDEKTAIQALDRLDPVLPLSPGRAERHGFEYYRHGTLSLYAALDTATGAVVGKTAARHTSEEFVAFLAELVARQPPRREIHIILDNLSAHKTGRVRQFLDDNPRVHLHFTPTYSSWLNQVENWFARIERDVIARGIFTSVTDLARKLMRYIRHHNTAAKPIKWTYTDIRNRFAATSSAGTGH
jgi:transposase